MAWRGAPLAAIKIGRIRGAESIHSLDMQVALNDFATLGRDEDVPEVRSRFRLSQFSRPYTHLPHRRGPGVFQPELRGLEGEFREHRFGGGRLDGLVRVN